MSRARELIDELVQEAPRGARNTIHILLWMLAIVLGLLILAFLAAVFYVLLSV